MSGIASSPSYQCAGSSVNLYRPSTRQMRSPIVQRKGMWTRKSWSQGIRSTPYTSMGGEEVPAGGEEGEVDFSHPCWLREEVPSGEEEGVEDSCAGLGCEPFQEAGVESVDVVHREEYPRHEHRQGPLVDDQEEKTRAETNTTIDPSNSTAMVHVGGSYRNQRPKGPESTNGDNTIVVSLIHAASSINTLASGSGQLVHGASPNGKCSANAIINESAMGGINNLNGRRIPAATNVFRNDANGTSWYSIRSGDRLSTYPESTKKMATAGFPPVKNTRTKVVHSYQYDTQSAELRLMVDSGLESSVVVVAVAKLPKLGSSPGESPCDGELVEAKSRTIRRRVFFQAS
ncbi:hypothetical protein KC347_g205 [Hortaea werneckii]|nr:hypothetical protein KC347_g205 [Hortaea werneckii]